MTDTQLYLAIGVPSLLALINIGVMLTLFLHLGARMIALETKVDQFRRDNEQGLRDLTGAVNELDKRLTRVEIKIGIQP